MQAGITVIKNGAAERDVAAACLSTMVKAGGHPPGFGPFICPAGRLGEEHTTWSSGVYRNGKQVFLELLGCVSRYHAPAGDLVRIGGISDEDARIAKVIATAFDAALSALTPGARACDAYAAWQGVVDASGLIHYRHHHCGYCVRIGQPPSWTGGNSVTGLRHDSELEIEAGMTFHVLPG